MCWLNAWFEDQPCIVFIILIQKRISDTTHSVACVMAMAYSNQYLACEQLYIVKSTFFTTQRSTGINPFYAIIKNSGGSDATNYTEIK